MKVQFAPKEFELNGNIIKHNHCVYMIPFEIPIYFVYGEGHLFGNNIPLKDMESFWCKKFKDKSIHPLHYLGRKEFYCYSKEDFLKLISFMNGEQNEFDPRYIPE